MIVIADDDSLASPATTPVDPTDMLAWLARDGVVLQSRGSVFGEQAYLCARGRRHPIASAARLEELGFRWPADVQPVPEKLLASYALGGGVPTPWRAAIDTATLGDAMAVREALACGLSGFGLEIGAGASPFPVPPRCRVIYGDRLTYEQLVAEPYPGQRLCDIVIPDVLTDFDTIENVADGSLDFLVACHVIEHTRNPIGSIAAACAATGVLVGMVSRPPQGQAVSGAIVRLGPASAIAGAIASASSDQQGRVRFDRVPSGSVEIEVVAAGLARRMILATVVQTIAAARSDFESRAARRKTEEGAAAAAPAAEATPAPAPAPVAEAAATV